MPPLYFVGSELFGAVYIAHGKTGVFEAMKDPRQLLALYASAIKMKPDKLGDCYKIPDEIIKEAMSIGNGM